MCKILYKLHWKCPVTVSNICNGIVTAQMNIHYATRPEAFKRYCLNLLAPELFF